MGFPNLQRSDWSQTKETVQRYVQVVSQVRTSLIAPMKHDWHHALYATARGLTTSPLLFNDKTVDFEFDFFNHELQIRTNVGEEDVISLDGQSIKEFREEIMEILNVFDIEPDISFSTELTDDDIRVYDDTAVENFWQALSRIDAYFKLFRSRISDESSPVQVWPDGLNLYLTILTGQRVPDMKLNEPELVEEQIYCGFSAGDHFLEEPYFYASAYPLPSDLPDLNLPKGARWQGEGMNSAVLPYAKFMEANDPKETLLAFLNSFLEQAIVQLGEQRSSH